ncbi:MAG: DUF2461 domain-containing protein [Candidatus Eremiobacteraeota bacterium]|nr:DUF2461 domain-containing protein [Candidatus Eremiobacteraeota bacterium]
MAKPAVETFTGFSARALKFLRDLKKNNDRAWFAPRKEVYERECLAPLRALTVALAAALRKAKIPIDVDPSRVGFRIHRDLRFSRDKSPYKTNLGTYLPYRGMRGAPGGLYVHVAPKSSFVAAAFYQLDREPLQRWREAMAADPKRFETVVQALKRNGVVLSEQGDALKRMPRGFEALAEHPIAAYFKLASFTVGRDLSDEDVMDEGLVAECVGLAKQAKPLLEYGWDVLTRADRHAVGD